MYCKKAITGHILYISHYPLWIDSSHSPTLLRAQLNAWALEAAAWGKKLGTIATNGPDTVRGLLK